MVCRGDLLTLLYIIVPYMDKGLVPEPKMN